MTFFQGDITRAQQVAYRRRQSLLLWVCAPDGVEEASALLLSASYLTSCCVPKCVISGTAECTQLDAVSPSRTVPRVHVIPPPSRKIVPLTFEGESLDLQVIGEAVCVANEWTADELQTVGRWLEQHPATRLPAISAAPAASSESAGSSPQGTPITVKLMDGTQTSLRVSSAKPGRSPTFAEVRNALWPRYISTNDFQITVHCSGDTSSAPARTISALEEDRLTLKEANVTSQSILVLVATSKKKGAPAATALSTSALQGEDKSSPKRPREPSASASPPRRCQIRFVLPNQQEEVIEDRGDADLASTVWPRLLSLVQDDRFFIFISSQRRRITVSDAATVKVSELDGAGNVKVLVPQKSGASTPSPVKASPAKSSDASSPARPADPQSPLPPTPQASLASPAAADVRIRLQLADGREVSVTFPSSTALREVARVAAEESQAGTVTLRTMYPPRAFTEEDLARTLAELDVGSAVTLRVAATTQPLPPPTLGTRVMSGVYNAASQFSRIVFHGSSTPAQPPPPSEATKAPPQAPVQPQPRQVGGVHTLFSSNSPSADNNNGKKAYYGGSSTAFQKNNSDDEPEDKK